MTNSDKIKAEAARLALITGQTKEKVYNDLLSLIAAFSPETLESLDQ